MHARTALSTSVFIALLAGCKSPHEEPEPRPEATSQAAAVASAADGSGRPVAQNANTASPKAPSQQPTQQHQAPGSAPSGDPLGGKFTLAEATQGLAGTGKLVADIQTDHGKLNCELYDDKAPNTVANFVGLARGLRPWKAPDGQWVKRPLYDGTTFHRIIKGFMIQGGDPLGTGGGDPGYVIDDEVWSGATHDRRGLLCMANRGKNTNGAQFFILDAAAKHLDGGYTIFGSCGPDSVIEKLASVPVMGERPQAPPKIQKVTIRRRS